MNAGTSLLLALLAALPAAAAVDDALPENLRVPAGFAPRLTLRGEGKLIYVCRAKAGSPGEYEWTLLQAVATLYDDARQAVGRYSAGPRWDLADGSQAFGTPIAGMTTPGGIPLQLVRIDETRGEGLLSHVRFVQRLATRGGLPPTSPCDPLMERAVEEVPYEASYVFFPPAR